MRLNVRSLGLLISAALFVSACGSKPADGPSGSAATGGVLVRAVNYGDPGNLDPIAKSDVSSRMVTMQIFDTLLRYDAVAKEIKKAVAEDYKVSDDGLTYTFTLRKGVLFHNGREMKAGDVKYSFERATDPKNGGVTTTMLDAVVGAVEFRDGKAKEITGITVKGDYSLEIKLKEVQTAFPLTLTGGGASIVPEEEVAKLGQDFGQKPVGSGPFKYKDWQKDDKLTLETFDKYYAGRAKLNGVVFRFMKEEQTRDAEFLAGSIDTQVLGEALYKKYAVDPERKKALVEVPELFTRAIHFNLSKPPFDNVKVRQAINYAVDKQTIIEKVLSNKAFVATGVLPSSAAAYNRDLKGYDFNVDKAKQLLQEAGYEKGFEFEVYTSASTTKWMEAINTYLNPLGINGKITQLELGTVLEKARNGDFQAVFYSTGGDSDSLNFVSSRFHSKNWASPATSPCIRIRRWMSSSTKRPAPPTPPSRTSSSRMRRKSSWRRRPGSSLTTIRRS